jgi:ribose transport system substrate-binding protein
MSELQTSSGDRRDRNEAQTVLRACEVLRAFRSAAEGLPLREVVLRTGLPKTTAFRLLRTLTHGGLLERTASGAYRKCMGTNASKPVRVGLVASQVDTEFTREVICGIEAAAAREHVQVLSLSHRFCAKEEQKNTDAFIREDVDLVLELQTGRHLSPAIASQYVSANVPVIAIETAHPGTIYFGADNFKAGQLAGRALGRWARENWHGRAERLVLLGKPYAETMLELRLTGLVDGLGKELPDALNLPMVRLDVKDDYDQILHAMRKFLRRHKPQRTLIGAVNDTCALAALRAFEEVGALQMCVVVGQNATREARMELRRSNTRLAGSVAYFPERYGEELIALALSILQKKSVPAINYVRHQLLTLRNVDLIYPLDELSSSCKKTSDELDRAAPVWSSMGELGSTEETWPFRRLPESASVAYEAGRCTSAK